MQVRQFFKKKRVQTNSSYTPNQTICKPRNINMERCRQKAKKIMAYLQCLSWIYKGFNYFGKRHFSKDGLQILNRWLWKWTLIKIKDNVQIKFSKKVQSLRNCKLGNDPWLLQGWTHMVSTKSSFGVWDCSISVQKLSWNFFLVVICCHICHTRNQTCKRAFFCW